MNLLNPVFLAGLGALAVPIVLHLIQRQRYPERAFTTVRFFDKTIKHNVIKARFVDKLLLLLRLAMLAALMLALARPFGNIGIGQQRMSLVIVLDNSPSMGRRAEGTTLFDSGRDAADAMLQQLGPNDRATLVLSEPRFAPAFTTDRAHLQRQLQLRADQPTGLLVTSDDRASDDHAWPATPGLTANTQELNAALAGLPAEANAALCGYGMTPRPRLTHDVAHVRRLLNRARVANTAGDMHRTVRRAADLLAESKDGDRVLVILSDLQNTDWHGEDPIDLDGTTVRVLELPADGGTGINLALEGCRVPGTKVRFGQRVTCAARVRNHGTVPSPPATQLAVTIGGQKQITKVPVPQIPPGSSQLVSFAVPAVARGQTVFGTVALRCPGDAFEYDNTWHLQIPVRPPMRVLCVNAGDTESDGDRSGFFVVNAMAPRTAGAQAAPFADINECQVTDLESKELFPYNVVILAGVEQLAEKPRERVRSFVEDGGGLLVFPGLKPAPEELNAWGFLPARVEAVKREDFAYVRSVRERSPATAALAALGGAAVQGLSSNTWLSLAPNDGATVLGRLENGSPALVEGTMGKGCVVMAAAGAHASSSDWPLRPAFVVLVRALAWYLADTGQTPVFSAERAVGNGVASAIPPQMLAGAFGAFRMELTGVSTDYAPLPWDRRNGKLVLPRTEQPGHYLVSVQPTGSGETLEKPGLGAGITAVAVNHSAAESILEPIPAARLERILASPALETQTLGETSLASMRTGHEIWRWVALFAIIVAFAEGIIAWRRPTDAAA